MNKLFAYKHWSYKKQRVDPISIAWFIFKNVTWDTISATWKFFICLKRSALISLSEVSPDMNTVMYTKSKN